MPRFVILRHELPSGHDRGSHWDLMFECGQALRTWAVESEPSAGGQFEARELANHRLSYLDYEGPISGDRGSVTRWDAGEYVLESADDDEWQATLTGERLGGRVTLRRASGHFWRVSFSAAPTTG